MTLSNQINVNHDPVKFPEDLKEYLKFAWQDGFERIGQMAGLELIEINDIINIVFLGGSPGYQTIPFINGLIRSVENKEIHIIAIDKDLIRNGILEYLFDVCLGKDEKYIGEIVKYVSEPKNEKELIGRIKKRVSQKKEKTLVKDIDGKTIKMKILNQDLDFFTFSNFTLNSVSIIPCFFIFHYLHNWRQLFERLLELLNDNGRIILIESSGTQKLISEEPCFEEFHEEYIPFRKFWQKIWYEVKNNYFLINRELTDHNLSRLRDYVAYKNILYKLNQSNFYLKLEIKDNWIIEKDIRFGTDEMLRWLKSGMIGYKRIENKIRQEIIKIISGKSSKISTKRKFTFFTVKKILYKI